MIQKMQWGLSVGAILVGALGWPTNVMAQPSGVQPSGSMPSGQPAPPSTNPSAATTTVSGYVRQGDRAFAAGNYAEAIQAYTQALALFNLNEYAFYNRGNAYRKLKDYPKAIADFTQVLALNPQNTFALLYRGMSQQAVNQTDAAIADYTALIKINDQEPLAYIRRAEAYASLKQRDLALADLRQASALYTKQKEPTRAEKVNSMMRSLK